MNVDIGHMMTLLAQRHVLIVPQMVAGIANVRAYAMSEAKDHQSYQSDRRFVNSVCRPFLVRPRIDLFDPQVNNQLPGQCSRQHDPQALSNAFERLWLEPMDANPPWPLIPQALDETRMDRATVLVCVPFEKTARWWSKLRLQQAALVRIGHG